MKRGPDKINNPSNRKKLKKTPYYLDPNHKNLRPEVRKYLEGALLDITLQRQKSSDFLYPLHLAIKEKTLHFANRLIERGVNVNKQRYDDATPLFIAAQTGHLESIDFLIERGADLNLANSRKETPLLIASELGHTSVVKYLIELGADLNMADKNGLTALMRASKNGYHEIVHIIRGALKIQTLSKMALNHFEKLLPSHERSSVTEEGRSHFCKKLFNMLFSRMNVVLMCDHYDGAADVFCEQLAKKMYENEMVNSSSIDSVIWANNLFVNAGRALVPFPREITNMIASYLPGYEYSRELLNSVYDMQKKVNRNIWGHNQTARMKMDALDPRDIYHHKQNAESWASLLYTPSKYSFCSIM